MRIQRHAIVALVVGAVMSVNAVIDGECFRVNEGMGPEVSGRNEIGGRCPPNPLGFTALSLAPAGGVSRAGLTAHPASCGLQGSNRRSGRFPALPYPPWSKRLQSSCFPFPFPWGCVERETGNGGGGKACFSS